MYQEDNVKYIIKFVRGGLSTGDADVIVYLTLA